METLAGTQCSIALVPQISSYLQCLLFLDFVLSIDITH